jgi:formyltetrahydrofolate deformylase
VHGCTAHFVTEQLDDGPVIMQDVFHINVGADTLDDVKANGLELEGRVLSKAVQLYLDEELVVVEGKVIFKPGISRFLKEDAKG